MVKHCQDKVPGSKNRSVGQIRLIVILLTYILFGVVSAGSNPAQAELDLADTPMLALVKSPPANLMFVLDESGSMTYEILIKGQYDGRYPSPLDTSTDKVNGFCYIFDYLGDNAYEWDDADARDEKYNLRYMLAEYRTFWKSQYYGENVMYYNPHVDYDPWTSYGEVTFADADKDKPKPHPTKSDVTALNLDAKSFTVKRKIDDVTDTDLKVKHAHYFDKSEEGNIYLIVIDGAKKKLLYYKVIETDGTDYVQKITKVQAVTVDELDDGIAAKRDYKDERQNFANWFTYHRKREYVAKAALAKVIKSLNGVRVGILGINGKIIVPLTPVDAKIDGVRLDDRNSILKELYKYDSRGGTPLREGLNDVGQYYQTNSKKLIHFKGGESDEVTPPYFSLAEGGACQQCFSIIMTDGYYSKKAADEPTVGNTDGGSDNVTEFDRKALADTLSNTLADVAMYYYENDLSPESDGDDPGLPDFVPTFGFDDATHQHMATFGVAFGVDGDKVDPDYYKHKMNQIYAENPPDGFSIPWPTEINEREAETIDDLYHATLNGRGQFFSADNPQQLTDSMLKLTRDITAQLSGSASAVTINGNQLYEEIGEDIRLFQNSYSNENEEWTGDVRAYGFSSETGKLDAGEDSHVWSAAKELEAKSWNERNIATYNPIENAGKEFEYDYLSDEQKKALGWDEVVGSDAETTARNRVDYLKGKDITEFRSRSQKLGDIVHSDPVFVNDVIYVGGNDGMLHAFNAKEFDPKLATDPDPGEELFAYIPNLVFENLIELTKPDYDHKFFVDLTPTVKKGAGLLEGKPPATASDFQTLLVGALGKGGKGYFALDVTDPFSMDTAGEVAQKVLWEFSVETDDDMGYSYSKPVVVRSYDDNHPWIVIFGNGYNSKNGYAVLYILDPTKKPGEGLLIKKFEMREGENNGLSSPTPVDVNFDNVVDYVYAGDLNGNLWKFDLTAKSVDDWEVAFHLGTDSQPLFKAVGPDKSIQPITSKPEVTFHPQKNFYGRHGYLVLFATGKFLEIDDFADASVQSVYGIWDYGDDEDDKEFLGELKRENNTLSQLSENITLLKQELTDFAYALPNGDVVDVRVLSDNEVNWEVDETNDPGQNPNPHETNPNHVGWYFDLSTRERVDQDVLLREGKLIVIGWIPDENLCTPGGGDSMFMEINAFTGGNLGAVQFDLTNGGILNENDLVNDPAAEDPDTAELIPPSGMLFRGKLQRPAIMRIDPEFRKAVDIDDNDGLDKADGGGEGCGEEKYLSTSTGQIRTVCERAVTLGMGSWKEVERDE